MVREVEFFHLYENSVLSETCSLERKDVQEIEKNESYRIQDKNRVLPLNERKALHFETENMIFNIYPVVSYFLYLYVLLTMHYICTIYVNRWQSI